MYIYIHKIFIIKKYILCEKFKFLELLFTELRGYKQFFLLFPYVVFPYTFILSKLS